MSTFKNKNRGFSLLESMVAITILLVAVVGPLSAIGDSLSQIYIARDQMVAINLAQEGIEAVRQIRDSDMIRGWNEGGTRTTSWNTTLGSVNKFYTVDVTAEPSLKDCSTCSTNSSIPFLKQDSEGKYGGTTGTDSKFRRVVRVEPITDSPDELKVTSTVFWETSGGPEKRIDVTESLFGINTITP